MDVRNLVKRSSKAVCGITERELTVKTKLKGIAINKLKAAGYRIIGTSYNGGATTKIWFIRPGGF